MKSVITRTGWRPSLPYGQRRGELGAQEGAAHYGVEHYVIDLARIRGSASRRRRPVAED